ncbi:DUF1178 family protein [Rhodoferax sp. PAMC 29310]|uniref:DUF1178 family protein n=1 Tax=Rhodoferax sp. PAMC 29310 TaxID=2822760 RepID=UPI001B31CBF1|nr:DUF1178 family protein [Rhodoferax sp. PAMC 29310]
MKVLDLQCHFEHRFEGWFSSEDDFASQIDSGALICPLCGDARIHKRLSAPRLNLGSNQTGGDLAISQANPVVRTSAMQAAWEDFGRHLAANTDDVGSQFAEVARKIHYGEIPKRGIRGKATVAETQALIEEGVPVLPMPQTNEIKGSLH